LGTVPEEKRTAAIKIFALLVVFPLILVNKPLGMDRPLLSGESTLPHRKDFNSPSC